MSKPHDTPADTRERTYERVRKEGVPRDEAKRLANEVAARLHDKTNRDGR